MKHQMSIVVVDMGAAHGNNYLEWLLYMYDQRQ